MNNILEDLKKYFQDTPREKVMSDWALTKKNAPKGGPKLREFILSKKLSYVCQKKDFFVVTKNNNYKNPKYSSGSLFLT